MRNLTINDATQKEILSHLIHTEDYLSRLATMLSGTTCSAEIVGMPDLGMPNNITRILGGFYTGALYKWSTDVPFIPIDTTMNVDSMCLYRLKDNILDSLEKFKERILYAKRETLHSPSGCSYVWNFQAGNHFISYGWLTGSGNIKDGWHIAFHSSASEYKNQINGLYPNEGNWYYSYIKTINDQNKNRYMRYIDGSSADKFYGVTKEIEKTNRHRLHFFASLICGSNNIDDEVAFTHHYGMPSIDSVAIGCQWLREGENYLLATAPGKRMFVVQAATNNSNRVVIDNVIYGLHPHGLGKTSKGDISILYKGNCVSINGNCYRPGMSLEDVSEFIIRDNIKVDTSVNTPRQIGDILSICPGNIIGVYSPLFEYYRGCGF